MNRPKNNNDDLTINSDSACIQGNQTILKRLQGHTNVQILNPIRNGEGFYNVLYFLVHYVPGVRKPISFFVFRSSNDQVISGPPRKS